MMEVTIQRFGIGAVQVEDVQGFAMDMPFHIANASQVSMVKTQD